MKMNEILNVIYWWGGVHTSFIGLYKQNHVGWKKKQSLPDQCWHCF